MSEDSYSLSSKVFHKLRNDILAGEYDVDEELKEKQIGDEMGVSRTPVREALRQLELEGLVNIIPNRGAFVVGVTQKDIKDIYEIRSYLEGLAAKWAASNISEAQLAELEENVFLCEFHAKKGNYSQVLELDNRFHIILYEACGSKELEHVLKDYHQYVARARKVTLADPKRVEASTREHGLVLQALRDHNAEEAEKCAREHIASTKRNMDLVGWDNICK